MSALRVSADKEVRREARTLTRLGFTLSHRSHGGKGHPVYTHPRYGRIGLASTPSDRNWVHAHRRQLGGDARRDRAGAAGSARAEAGDGMRVIERDSVERTVTLCLACGYFEVMVTARRCGKCHTAGRVIEFVRAEQFRRAAAEVAVLRRIVAATRDYLLLAPDDSVDYEALLTRVRSALEERGTT
jgi:hypothetical protein